MKSIDKAHPALSKQAPPNNSIETIPHGSSLNNKRFLEGLGLNSKYIRLLSRGLSIGVALYKALFHENGVVYDLITLDVNTQYERLVGLRRQQILMKNVTDIYPKIKGGPINWIDLFGRVAATGNPDFFEALSPINNRYYHIYVYSPKKGYVAAFFMDITQQNLSQQSLIHDRRDLAAASNAKKYFHVIKHAPVGVCIVASGPKFVSVNEGLCKMLGYTEQELLSINPIDLLPVENRKNFQEKFFKKIMSKGHIGLVEYKVKTQNGREIWCAINATLILLGDKKGAFIIVHDITARKKADAELAIAEKRYRQLYDTTRDGIMARNLNGKMLHCNRAYANMLGYTKQELRRMPVEELIPEKWLELRRRMIDKVLETGRSIVFEREYRRKDGSIFSASIRTWPLTSSKGKMVGVWSIVRDITDQKTEQKSLQDHADTLERLVAERTKQLNDSERLAAIGQTAAMVGHDLRNPLQTITGELYLAKTDVNALPDGEVKTNLQENIAAIEEQTVYMNKIVSDLQAFVQPIQVDNKPVNLQELLTSTVSTVAVPDNVAVHINVTNPLCHVNVDPNLLKRVLINLITNAMQAMPNGGDITITAEINAHGEASIKVKDTGTGIPDEIKHRIFSPLFTTKPRGQGFGLAVCKRVMEAHGGAISFESTVGGGTTFTLTLPPQGN